MAYARRGRAFRHQTEGSKVLILSNAVSLDFRTDK